MEAWRAIPTWEGLYEVSSTGRVRSLDRVIQSTTGARRYRGRVLRTSDASGYALVVLLNATEKRRKLCYVHDLVAVAFIGPKPRGYDVCHGPLGGSINTVANLRYGTRSSNALDRHLFGVGWKKFGNKPATPVRCAVCQKGFSVTRRRNARSHICKDPECRRTFGQICRRRHGS